MLKRICHIALIAFWATWMTPGWAEEPRTVSWDDLLVRLSTADNPFNALTDDQLLALGDVAGLRDRKERGVALTAEESAIEKKALAKLKLDGIDVDGLLAKRDAIAERKRAAARAGNPAIDGKIVRIPGYVWVTGKIAANLTKKSVEIVDGSADVEVAYSLRATSVEPYE